MQKNMTFSNSKIITFVIFICVALLTMLFMFHSRYQPQQTLLSPDIGMVFPAAREIKSFDLVTADQQVFKQKNFYRHWTLLFFGFTHCGNVCPVTLDVLNKAYQQLQAHYANLQVVFISLDPERDTPILLEKYIHGFNSAFIGVTGSLQELRKLQSQFGVFAARDATSTADAYQLQHTASIMLVNPQGKWAGLFQYGLRPEQLVQGFEKIAASDTL